MGLSQVIINATNSAFFFGGGGGASVSQASGVGAFSSSALVGDCIVRSQGTKQLILQSGSGVGAIIINSANNTNINGVLTVLKNNWILSSDGVLRIYFGDNGTTYFHSGNTGTGGFNFRNFAQSDIFTINENGNVSATGAINVNGNSLVFPNTLADFKISLWGPNIYGFGVQANELKYISGLNHKFYNGTTNTFSIDGSGNTSCPGSITTGGSLSGAPNVSKRSLFTFTPTPTLMSRYFYVIDLTQYISFLSAPICNHYIFRIHLWSQSGDFGDSSDVVENMTYLVYLSTFGSGKSRFYQIVNSSTSSTLSFINGTSVYYSGSPNSAGASVKYCAIENISGY